MAGSSLLFFGSSICLDPRLELLSGPESNYTTRADRNFLAGFWITTRALILIAQVEITEPREFNLFAGSKGATHLFKEQVDQLTRFAFVQAELIKQRFRHFCLGESHRLFSYSCVQARAQFCAYRGDHFVRLSVRKSA